MYLLILWAVVGLGAAGAGCAGVGVDGGEEPYYADAAGSYEAEVPDGSRRLELVSERLVGLMPGDTAVIRVVLTGSEDDMPIRNAHVSFGFVGVAQDASLEKLDVATDKSGAAANTLAAGELGGTFTVVVSAPGAKPLTVLVSIGSAGFGTLVVQAPYTGERLVSKRRVAIVPNESCADAEPNAGDHMVLLSDPGVTGEFLLPAGEAYAVVTYALGPQDTMLATGCGEVDALAADTTTTVEVPFADLSLEPTGDYDLYAQLEVPEPAATLATELEQAAVARIETSRLDIRTPGESGARMLLDALEDTLRSTPYAQLGLDVLADGIVAERATPTLMQPLDEQLQLSLSESQPPVGPRIGASALAAQCADNLQEVQLLAKVAVDGAKIEAPLTLRPWTVEVETLADGRPGPAIDLTEQGTADVDAILLIPADGIEVRRANFTLPWGALADGVMTVLLEADESGTRQAMLQSFGCEAFSQWVQNAPTIDGMCDEACAQQACELAFERMTDAASQQLLSLDGLRPTVTLWGELLMIDDTGDLEVERMDALGLEGEWDTDGDIAERFNGSASAEVLRRLLNR